MDLTSQLLSPKSNRENLIEPKQMEDDEDAAKPVLPIPHIPPKSPHKALEDGHTSASSKPENSSDEDSNRKRKSGEHVQNERKRAKKMRLENHNPSGTDSSSDEDASGGSSSEDEENLELETQARGAREAQESPKGGPRGSLDKSEQKRLKRQKRKNMRRNIKHVLSKEQLDTGTKEAQAAEEERLRRLQEQQHAQRKQLLQEEFLRQIKERRLKELRELEAQQQEIIQLSSDLSSDSDILLVSDNEVQEVKDQALGRAPNEDNEPEDDPNDSGMHVDDRLNVPDSDGNVLVNVGHSQEDRPIYLASQLARMIKPHQIGGIRFLYDNVIESQTRYSQSQGFGCILAHSMGLGKTIQLVTFCDIFLKATPGRHILCIVPINTIQNWLAEFNHWLPTQADQSSLSQTGPVEPRCFQVHALNDSLKNLEQRTKIIADWRRVGGVLLMGYELYRQFACKKPRKARKKKNKGPECIDLEEEDKTKSMLNEIQEALINPGPDLVICDEGHRIKNSHASISQTLKAIRTKRRIVLTGYPLQNNLMEYWCMVDFVRPNFLGTKTEFSNMFERPIQNGQCLDSTPKDFRLMLHRAHVLHTQLKGFVQRRGHKVLQQSLPPKNEHVILLRMTDIQRALYKRFMDELVFNRTVSNPLKAFAVCCKIWNHPDVLHQYMMKLGQRGLLDDLDIELDEFQSSVPNANKQKKGKKAGSARGNKPAIPAPMDQFQGGFNPFLGETKKDEISYDWAQEIMSTYQTGQLENSAKFQVFFAILDETIKAGDRLLLFSQSLLTLNLIEEYLQERQLPGSNNRTWIPGQNYYRLDGSTAAQERERLINAFNASSDIPLFMVSTRAGSLGINLVGANRVVVLDASWNPCHDSQAVCRVYRYGQTKVSHIYRLVCDNSIEKKIYDRQVNKQGMADRVVDEQNPDNHLSSKDINSLICENEQDPPIQDHSNVMHQYNDDVLKNVIRDHGYLMTKEPFTHESLLVDRKEKKLTRAEKRLAERSYALERTSKITYTRPSYAAFYPQAGGLATNLNQPGSNGLTRASYAHQYQQHLIPEMASLPSSSSSASTSFMPHNHTKWFQRPVANVRPFIQDGASPTPSRTPLELNHQSWDRTDALNASQPYFEPCLKDTNLPYPNHGSDIIPNCGVAQISPEKRMPPAPNSSVTGIPYNSAKKFPAEALAKQGVDMQEILIPKDMLIPTNSTGQPPIALKQGQKVMVIRTPKGIYLRMGEKIIKIRLPQGLLSAMVNGNASQEQPLTTQPPSTQLPQQQLQPTTIVGTNLQNGAVGTNDVVTLSDSSSDELPKANIAATNPSPAQELFQMVTSAGSTNYHGGASPSPIFNAESQANQINQSS
ncbi:helicase ARIP4-like isoform X2 [Tigriopus californicus]|nr:helicase ARIP4-like isoform X2 [Tigriopus californicus]XP_059099679.1 helicase ARIP4-like isoform X2 [Tigriopus californicus]